MCQKICIKNGDCKERQKCVGDKGNMICQCADGLGGTNCDKEEWCSGTGKFKDCKGDGGKCEYSKEKRSVVCTCANGRKLDAKDNICRECDCGKDALDCSIVEHMKQCSCKAGYAVDNGQCKRCDCGEDASDCSFHEKVKQCTCSPGYRENNGMCQKICIKNGDCKERQKCVGDKGNMICQCADGLGGTNCDKEEWCSDTGKFKDCKDEWGKCEYSKEKRSVVCTCASGRKFDAKDNICRECDCGKDASDCSIVEHMKQCSCKTGYAVDDGQCKRCDCGEGASDCSFHENVKQCTCSPGYRVDNGMCQKICNKNGDCKERQKCVGDKGNMICQCADGLGGTNCDVEEWCNDTGKFKDCKGDGDKCEYNKEWRSVVCTCGKGRKLDDEENICRGCDCGEGASNCSFFKKEKQCTCSTGYRVDKGMCQKICIMNDDCKERRKCVGDKGNMICICADGLGGTNCDEEEWCRDTGKFKDCKGDGDKCEYSKEKRSVVCTCGKGRKLDDEENICRELPPTSSTTTTTIHSTIASTEQSEKTTETSLGKYSTVEEKITSKSTPPVSSTSELSTLSTKEPDDEVKNICDENKPCQNGGTCEVESEKSSKCICMIGFIGSNCEIIQWCHENKEICGKTPCKYDEKVGSAFCFCEEGLYFDGRSKKCIELDKCLFARIKGNCSAEHETCDKKGNCKCEENYAYNDAKTACEPDFCWEKSKGRRCGENMKCSPGDKTFSCSCEEAYRQIGDKCIKVDKCAPGISKCQQLCRNGNCSCTTGFDLVDDGQICNAKETQSACDWDCGVGTCIKEGGKEKCICPDISHVFRDKTCVDRCKANDLKKNECPEKIGCLSDEERGYKCNCSGKYGFAEDGVHCKALRMCSEGDGDEVCSLKGGVCEDNFALAEGYKCKCKFGYKENPKTGVCEHMCETAHCDKQQALCSINVKNQAECICPPLLVKDKSGRCSELAKFSYLGEFSVPKRKYEVDTDTDRGRMKRDTSKDINYAKLLKDFEDSMDKIFDGYKGTSILNCTDDDDDWKCFLEIKLNKDPKGKINIISTPSVCLPLSEESHCLIPPAFITKKRTADEAQVFQKTHPCDKGINGKLCGNETECEASEPGFKCKCKPGYFRRHTYVPAENVQVEVCEDIDECLNPLKCPNTTTCSNLPGSYTCKCKDGYRLEEGMSVKINGCIPVCDPNPCVHGLCSESGKDGFSCSCEELYTGRFCNQTNEAVTGAKKAGMETSAIVGGVLGAFLVMAIIICILLFLKVRKSKSGDDTDEYMRQRNRGLVSEMWKLGRRQPDNKDTELRDNERRPNRENEDPKFGSQLRSNPIDSLSIPRPQLGRATDRGVNSGRDTPEMRESGDYRRGYSGEDRMFPKAHSSRKSDEEPRRSDRRQEMPRRPSSRSSDHLDYENAGVSRMQYRNRGYEED